VEALPTGAWHGPFESVQGVHLVRVAERHPPEPGVFENLETYLRQEWLMTRTRELQQERVAEIRAGYRIELAEQ
jgi:parvulin-like peptidyl-prolyl isomerase